MWTHRRIVSRGFGALLAAVLLLPGCQRHAARPDDFCAAVRSAGTGAAQAGLLARADALTAMAPQEIRADAEYLNAFSHGMLSIRLPAASGPGVALLAMNPEFQAVRERIAGYLERTCGIPATSIGGAR